MSPNGSEPFQCNHKSRKFSFRSSCLDCIPNLPNCQVSHGNNSCPKATLFCQRLRGLRRFLPPQQLCCAILKEYPMKLIATLIAGLFATSAFAAEPAKAPVATPAVTKADAPKPEVKKDEKKPVKSDAKPGDKKAATPATPASAPTSKWYRAQWWRWLRWNNFLRSISSSWACTQQTTRQWS